MEKEQIKNQVIEKINEVVKYEIERLEKIIKNASVEELSEAGAVCDLYTAVMQDAARQLATNTRQYSRSVHRKSRERVRRFWWLAQC